MHSIFPICGYTVEAFTDGIERIPPANIQIDTHDSIITPSFRRVRTPSLHPTAPVYNEPAGLFDLHKYSFEMLVDRELST